MADRIMVVDDDALVRGTLGRMLAARGYDVFAVGTARDAEAEFRQRPPDLAIVDHQLLDGTGLDLLASFKAFDQRVPVVMITGHASIELAVDAVKRGAEQFLTKPIGGSALLAVVQGALDGLRDRRRLVTTPARSLRGERDPFAGKSDAIRRIADEARKLLETDRPVLIQGETGTGKGVLAAWLHGHGPRAAASFVDINCASLSGDLLESELFGHERGAFTGAATAKPGLLEVGDGGSVFLDEIAEIDLALQPRLLKVLEDKRFRRLGDVRDRTVDVRLLAATNRDLAELAARGAFRADLYYRINALAIVMPPLRDRPEDIPILAGAVAADAGAERPIALTPAALRRLQSHRWPGNIRELRNVIERAVILSDHAAVLDEADLRIEHRAAGGAGGDDLPDHLLTLEEMEYRHVERVVRLEGGAIDRAASRLGVSRSTLYHKLKRVRERRGTSR